MVSVVVVGCSVWLRICGMVYFCMMFLVLMGVMIWLFLVGCLKGFLFFGCGIWLYEVCFVGFWCCVG